MLGKDYIVSNHYFYNYVNCREGKATIHSHRKTNCCRLIKRFVKINVEGEKKKKKKAKLNKNKIITSDVYETGKLINNSYKKHTFMTKESSPPRMTIIVTYSCQFVAAFTCFIALFYTVWSKMLVTFWIKTIKRLPDYHLYFYNQQEAHNRRRKGKKASHRLY